MTISHQELPSSSVRLSDADLPELAQRIVRRAVERGASGAECIIRDGREFSATVRLGEVESLKEAGGKGLGIRVFRGRKTASTYTSDFDWPAIEQMIDAALAMADLASDDPFAGLPDSQDLGQLQTDLQLYSPLTTQVTTEQAIEMARRAERAALDCDPRLTNSDGASFDSGESRKILANSLGFLGEYRRSSCSLSAVPIASENGRMQRDYWYSIARDPEQLDSPEEVGRIAAERTLRRLGGRKIATTRVPILFEPQVARSIIDHVFQAANGEAIYRSASFLKGKLGEIIAHPGVTILDDSTIPGRAGSSPFDGEGVLTRRTPIVTAGRLENFLLNTYTARKLGMHTTGNASRGLTGNPGVGAGNLWLEPGQHSPQEMIAELKQGFYVTELIGFGINMVTGDYSRGASGIWIENGELTYPVEEVTIAGNLGEMLRHLSGIGNDLEFRTSASSPTILIEGMTVAGA